MKTTFLCIFVSVVTQSFAQAQTFVGTIVATKGDVKVLSLAAPGAPGPFARYEGRDYSYVAAKLGKKVKPGEVIQSGTDGRAKIVYPNGDHFIIGNGTSMELPEINSAEKKDSSVKLIYGRVRALVSKTGPHKQLKIKTPTAVAGVRGTDFFLRANHDVGTQLTVLRGEVEVANALKPEQVKSVKTGFMIHTSATTKEPLKIEEVTREELTAIQEEAASVTASTNEVKMLSKAEQEDIKLLVDKTKEAVLNDIAIDDPKLHAELKSKKLSTEELNQAVIDKLFHLAPAGKKKKPTSQQVEGIGDDVYDKYYKQPEKKR